MSDSLTDINVHPLSIVLQSLNLARLVIHRQNCCQHPIQIENDLMEIQTVYLSIYLIKSVHNVQ